MVAGTLASSGYHMGDDYIKPRESNQKGFFEDYDVNAVNEWLIAQHVPAPAPLFGRWLHPDRLRKGQRWLAELPGELRFRVPRRLEARITRLTELGPYCYKDPRFCYTLPAWRPFLHEPVFVCVFREPTSTASSMVKECSRQAFLRNVRMTPEHALDIWSAMYGHVLRHRREGGDWLFLHYDDVLSGRGLAKLAKATGANVDETFPDRRLRRSEAWGPPPSGVARLYRELCELARYGED